MALNNSGPINLSGSTAGQSIALELGLAPGTQLNLGNASVRTLAGVPSGAITMPTNFYGKSSTFSFSITANQQEANLRSLALTAGWNGSSAVIATVNAGVYIWSDATGTAALTINGSWPGGVTLVNNGYIIGKGGTGGQGVAANSSSLKNGAAGGPAISLGVNVTITNNSGAYIAGGGGGGAGSGSSAGGAGGAGGGGAGGGVGGSVPTRSGGTAGAVGSSGGNGSNNPGDASSSGGGGGRILPGTGGAGGASSTWYGFGGGSGGGGGAQIPYYANPTGGTGGSAGNTGGNATNPNSGDVGGGGGGGGWGASGGSGSNGAGGTAGTAGSGGKAIALNGFTATRSGAGTTYGAVS